VRHRHLPGFVEDRVVKALALVQLADLEARAGDDAAAFRRAQRLGVRRLDAGAAQRAARVGRAGGELDELEVGGLAADRQQGVVDGAVREGAQRDAATARAQRRDDGGEQARRARLSVAIAAAPTSTCTSLRPRLASASTARTWRPASAATTWSPASTAARRGVANASRT